MKKLSKRKILLYLKRKINEKNYIRLHKTTTKNINFQSYWGVIGDARSYVERASKVMSEESYQ